MKTSEVGVNMVVSQSQFFKHTIFEIRRNFQGVVLLCSGDENRRRVAKMVLELMICFESTIVWGCVVKVERLFHKAEMFR